MTTYNIRSDNEQRLRFASALVRTFTPENNKQLMPDENIFDLDSELRLAVYRYRDANGEWLMLGGEAHETAQKDWLLHSLKEREEIVYGVFMDVFKFPPAVNLVASVEHVSGLVRFGIPMIGNKALERFMAAAGIPQTSSCI